MDEPGYTIDIDADRDLLIITPVGLWDTAMLSAHRHDFDRAVRKLGGRPYRILADLRGFAVQPQEVNSGLQTFVSQQKSVRTATLLSGSALQRMQSQRIAAANDVIRVFGPDQEAEAHDWLFAD